MSVAGCDSKIVALSKSESAIACNNRVLGKEISWCWFPCQEDESQKDEMSNIIKPATKEFMSNCWQANKGSKLFKRRGSDITLNDRSLPLSQYAAFASASGPAGHITKYSINIQLAAVF